LAGRYRFERLIATGGMAQVWEATDLVLDRRVAVKLLHAHLADDEMFVERFRREAIAAARLAHPAIVSIFDTYSGDGMEAIVMELVHGLTLRQELDRRQSLPPAEAVRIGIQVADALAVAHQSRLVHRDIKPANILLCDDERVMVADFGIAKLDEGGDHTKEGTMLGTAKYLAPEQVEGRPVDARTDVYALGVVLYEMLCGRPPFDADTDVATALARLHSDPPRPRQIKADLPRALDDVVMRAMAREPDGRFATAAELRAALQSADLGSAPDRPVHYADNTAITAVTPPAGTPAVAAGTAGGAAGRGTPPAAAPPSRAGRAKRERSILFPAIVVLFVAVALAVAGVLIGNTLADRGIIGGPDTTETTEGGGETAAPTEVVVTTATPFDPEIGDGENDDVAPRAIDDDPATAWATSTYASSDFGGLKDGLGLILTLDQAAALATLTVNSPTPGWTADVYVADSAAPDLAGWGEPVATGQTFGDGDTTVDLAGASGSEVLIWITALPQEAKVEIADASVTAA
jgi:serine/threonine-protein kinase